MRPPDPAPSLPSQQVLGLPFTTADLPDIFHRLEQGGYVVAPAAPALADIPQAPAYYQALKNATVIIADSGFMVRAWRILEGITLPRISGLRLLQAWLDRWPPEKTDQVFWVHPHAESQQHVLRWLKENDRPSHEALHYQAPMYDPSSLQDQDLLQRIREQKPAWIVINLGGGTQEILGQYLHQHIDWPCGILCTGAAMGFITGTQVHIPTWADRLVLGWLFRILSNPRTFFPRYLKGLKLWGLLKTYRGNDPTQPRILFIAPFPPPAHGQSICSAALYRRCTTLDVALFKRDSSHPKGLMNLVKKVGSHLQAGWDLRRGRFDKVYLSLNANRGMGLTRNLARLAIKQGLPTLLHHHTYAHLTKPHPVMRDLTEQTGDRLTHVFLAKSMAHQFLQTYPTATQHLVLNNSYAVNPSASPAVDIRPPLRIGHLSNLSMDKGLEQTLRMITELIQQGLDLSLHLAGPFASKKEQELVDTAMASHPNHIHYAGPVYGAEKDQWFAQIDYFILLSTYANESQPLVLLEALARHRPCIVLDTGAIGELLQESGSLVIDPDGGDHNQALRDYLEVDISTHQTRQLAAAARHQALRDEGEKQWLEFTAWLTRNETTPAD